MRLTDSWSWFGGSRRGKKQPHRNKFSPRLQKLEDRTVPQGYLAVGAGAGAPPLVAIRIDRIDALGNAGVFPGSDPNNVPPLPPPADYPPGAPGWPPPLGSPNPPGSDGRTDTTTQTFLAYDKNFLGGVHVTTGNFDGFVDTFRRDLVTLQVIPGPDGFDDRPDYLVTAPGPGGGPHVKIYRMVQDPFGNIITQNLEAEFMAYDSRFRGGVSVATGDLDGDGRAELITGAGPGGGPHVRIWRFDPVTRTVTLIHEFMAYDSRFRGGVSVASGQGYQVPIQVRQELDAEHPDDFFETPYPAAQGVPKPGVAQGFPLSETILNAAGDPVGSFTVGSGFISYVGANLFNNYGNLSYTPNVDDNDQMIMPGVDDEGQEFALVYATWPEDSVNRPAFMPFDIPIGPFIRLPDAGDDPVVIPMTAGPGSVHFRNQLVTGAGPGGGPIVRVWDFVGAVTGGLSLNGQIEFNGLDPNDRGGINVAIGTVTEVLVDTGTTITPDATGPTLFEVTFPFVITPSVLTDPTRINQGGIYTTFQPAIMVTSAGGSGAMRAFTDTVIRDGLGRVTQKTQLSELNIRPVNLDADLTFDPGNPLGGYFSYVADTVWDEAISPQYRGEILAAVSALRFNGAAALQRSQYTVGAGARQSPIQVGPRVQLFDNLAPTFGPVPNTIPGNLDPQFPVDDFLAFLSGSFPNGIGGVAFGFGQLPMPSGDVVTLPPRGAETVSDPIYVPPTPQP